MRNLMLAGAMLAMALPVLADQTINGVTVKRGARVDIVFFTADDCKYCAKWKAESKEDALKWAKSRNVGFHQIDKPLIKDAYKPAQFPAAAGFAWEDIKASGKANFMIPRWVVYADQRPVMSASALRDWSRLLRFAQDVVDARDARN